MRVVTPLSVMKLDKDWIDEGSSIEYSLREREVAQSGVPFFPP